MPWPQKKKSGDSEHKGGCYRWESFSFTPTYRHTPRVFDCCREAVSGSRYLARAREKEDQKKGKI